MRRSKFLDAKILIIGEEPEKVRFNTELLHSGGYSNFKSVPDAKNAAQAFKDFAPDIMILDLRLRPHDGHKILKRIKSLAPSKSFLPILVLPPDTEAEEAMRASSKQGAIDFLTKPFSSSEMLLRVGDLLHARALHLDLKNERVRVEEDAKASAKEVVLSQADMLEHLARAAEYRDDVAGTHIRRVGAIVEMLAAELGVKPMVAGLMGKASLVHDLGKIAISDAILMKPGRLSPKEYERIKAHARFGAEMLKGGRSKLMRTSESIARFHHERWDGNGYEGLKGELIPLEARITAVADVYDTLRSRRPYKEAWTHESAVAEIAGLKGTHFDPVVVDAFLRIAPGLEALFDRK